MAAPVHAQEAPFGCFARDYDAAHLAAHPAQVVERLRLNFYRPEGSAPDSLLHVNVMALMANQGHAAQDEVGGLVMTDTGFCNRPTGCGIEGDGGTFEITHFDGDTLDIVTSHLRVGIGGGFGGEGIYSSLGETFNEYTTYRLHAAPPEACSEF